MFVLTKDFSLSFVCVLNKLMDKLTDLIVLFIFKQFIIESNDFSDNRFLLILKLIIDELHSKALKIRIAPSSPMFVFVNFKSFTLQGFVINSSETIFEPSSPTSLIRMIFTVTVHTCIFIFKLIFDKNNLIIS